MTAPTLDIEKEPERFEAWAIEAWLAAKLDVLAAQQQDAKAAPLDAAIEAQAKDSE